MSSTIRSKYICSRKDLDKLLPDDVASEFREVFAGEKAWRVGFGRGSDAEGRRKAASDFWDRFGVSFDHPTVRAAVAIDLVKLDDDEDDGMGRSVSNDSTYYLDEHLYWSTAEHERWILNRNFRINLVNLENGWSNISYSDGTTRLKRKVERVFQGARPSATFLDYFRAVFSGAFQAESGEVRTDVCAGRDVYLPFTNANDFTVEVSLIPNTHPDFDPIVSRAYYDHKYAKYKKMMRRRGILAISTFALVDPDRDKTHTGVWLVKVQKRFACGRYGYIVLKIDSEGQVVRSSQGIPDVLTWSSDRNEILSVCESDFQPRSCAASADVWAKDIGDVHMVKSTTSSHYSVFRQRIPSSDLNLVRHYIQFRTRLEGMELMLKILKRNVHLKEVQASECFAKETMCVSRLFQEFKSNEDLMNLAMQYYSLIEEYDGLYMKLVHLRSMQDERQKELDGLVAEYNALSAASPQNCPDQTLDRKIALGQKIRSARLEMDRTVESTIQGIKARLRHIAEEVKSINEKVKARQEMGPVDMDGAGGQFLEDLGSMFQNDSEYWRQAIQEVEDKADGMAPDGSRQTRRSDVRQSKAASSSVSDDVLDVFERHILEWRARAADLDVRQDSDEDPSSSPLDYVDEQKFYKENYDPLESIDESRLRSLILASERMKGYMQNMGCELMQMKQMLTMCEDATIKVRRLLHNFRERMERTEADVWDENHMLKGSFTFRDISTAGIRDIVLLHDWYACNAPEKTAEEMGMTEDEFMQFRRRCNSISYSLRTSQYAKAIAMKRQRAENLLMEITDRLNGKDTLHWKDKYGWEAKREQDSLEQEKWSVEDASQESVRRVSEMVQADGDEGVQRIGFAPPAGKVSQRMGIFAKAESALRQREADERQYERDAEEMRSRTLSYLKEMGIAEGEDDLERLATLGRTVQFKGDVDAELKKVEDAKWRLDQAISMMNRERSALQKIIDGVVAIEGRIKELEAANSRILSICVSERNRHTRNQLLLARIENGAKIAELRQEVKSIKGRHLEEFGGLEQTRGDVDRAQAEYDDAVRAFKETIGSDREAVESLIVGIYNRLQDEILNADETRRKRNRNKGGQ